MDDNDSQLDLQGFKNLISHLDEDDLLTLNRMIAERIKFIRAEKKIQSMAGFEVGDAVFFHDKKFGRVDATVLRLNKKTLSLVTDEGQRWNVAPELCQVDNPVTGDLFEPGGPYQNTNVSVLPGAAVAQSAGKGRWYGGAVEMPAYVTEEGQPYRPFIMLWVDAEGFVVASDLCPPQSDFRHIGLKTLRQAMHSPMTGEPRRPKYITVNDRDLVDFLAEREPGIHVEYGDTPMLSDVIENMEHMMPPGDAADTYLSTGLSPDRIASFFDAAAALYRSAPWQQVPHDATLLCVTIESLGIHDAVLSVIGQLGESFAIVLYSDLHHFDQFRIAGDRMNRGEACDVPPHIALSFDEGADVHTAVRKEIAEHGWQVADTAGYPVLFAPDRGNILRPIVAADVALFDALARALPTVLKSQAKLIKAWNGEGAFQRKLTVDSMGDQVTVEIAAPYPFEKGYASKDPSDTTMIELAQLAHSADDPDFGIHNDLCDTLQALFFESPEGKKCANGSSMVTPLLHFAFSYQSATIATLQAGALEEVVFEIVPRKVMVQPDEAKRIIEEYRLFYRFLKRQYALPQADHCLKVLGGNAISRMKAALGDSSGFGPGKAALASGFLPPGFGEDLLPPGLSIDQSGMAPMESSRGAAGKPVDASDKKKKRKAAKKARKKNR